MSDEHEAGFTLAMPFVVCQSQGGPYEDQAFVAGYALGQIDTKLAVAAVFDLDQVWAGPVRTDSLSQLDLIAMRHGCEVEIGAGDEEWTTVMIRRADQS